MKRMCGFRFPGIGFRKSYGSICIPVGFGVDVQENLAVFSQNMPECLYVDFGAYGVRAVTIPFYATSSESQVVYMVNDAEIRYVFVGEQYQYDIAFRSMPHCPTLQKLIIFDSSVVKNPQDTVSVYFEEFLQAGAGHEENEELKRRAAELRMDDLANILYTSGTTGASKGVMLSHRMYHDAIIANDAVLTLGEKDVVLNFLPFTHVFERAWSYLCLSEVRSWPSICGLPTCCSRCRKCIRRVCVPYPVFGRKYMPACRRR